MNEQQRVLARMLEKDNFTRWLGIVIDEHGIGYCKLHYTISDDMLNGFGTVHGGIIFSAADSAFAFACNSRGVLTVALDVNICYIRPCKTGDTLYVEAKEIHSGNRTGFYNVTTTNEEGAIVAVFKGTAYITGKNLL